MNYLGIDNLLKECDEKIKDFYRNLNATKEEMIRAFVAKYGYQPDEIEAIEQDTEFGKRFFVQKKGTNPECSTCKCTNFQLIWRCECCGEDK